MVIVETNVDIEFQNINTEEQKMNLELQAATLESHRVQPHTLHRKETSFCFVKSLKFWCQWWQYNLPILTQTPTRVVKFVDSEAR